MRYFVLSLALLFSCIGFAQGVKQADLVGTWHFSKWKSDEGVMMDIADPKTGQANAIKLMKKKNPNATKDDENKTIEQYQRMLAGCSKMYCTYKADGTCEVENMGSASQPDGKPQKGTYKLESNGTKLKEKFDGETNEETIPIKIQDGILVVGIPEMHWELEFKK